MKLKITLLALWFCSPAYSMTNEEMVMGDIQNLRLSMCEQSLTEQQIASYDPVFGFHLAISTVSKPAYDLSLRYATETANKKTCIDGDQWITAIKNKFKE